MNPLLRVVVCLLLTSFLSAFRPAGLSAASPGNDKQAALDTVVAASLKELREREEAAMRTPKLFVYRSPVRKENDVHRYFVLWHKIESHRAIIVRVSDNPEIFRGGVWVYGRAFRKADATPEAALRAPAVELGVDKMALVFEWHQGAWRKISKVEWEHRLDDVETDRGNW